MPTWDEAFADDPKAKPKGASWEDAFAAPPPAKPAPAVEPEAPSGEDVPWTTRLAIGTARDEQTREETIKRYYPDAKKDPKGYHVFTSPTTGKPTYVNPPGRDLGDVADWVRTGAEAAGGVVGGGAGAAAGGPAGAVLGAGGGSAIAGQLVDAARAYFGQPQAGDAGSIVHNVAGDTLAGMAGEGVGQGLARVGGAFARNMIRPGAAETVAAAEKAGVPPTAAMTMRPTLAMPEHAAAQVLPYSRPQRATNELFDTASREIAALKPATPAGTMEPANVAEAAKAGGSALKGAAAKAYETFKAERLARDNEFYGALPPGVRFKLPSVAKATTDVQADIAKSPGVQGEALKPVTTWLERINADLAANGGALPADALRRLKTQLGAELETGATTELAGPVQARLKALYAGINGDLKAATAQVSPKAAAALHRHDAFVTAFRGEDLGRESTAKAMDSVLKANSDEAAWTAFNTGGADRMKALVGRLNDDEHAIVARSVFERMTTTPAGNETSPTMWATKWLATPGETKQALFGKIADVDKMDALATVLREQAKGKAGTNTSNTAYELQRGNLLGNMAKMVGGAAGGGGLAAMGVTTPTAIGVPLAYGLAELYRPAVIKGIVRKAAEPVKDTVLKRMIGQLGAEAGFDLLPEGRRR